MQRLKRIIESKFNNQPLMQKTSASCKIFDVQQNLKLIDKNLMLKNSFVTFIAISLISMLSACDDSSKNDQPSPKKTVQPYTPITEKQDFAKLLRQAEAGDSNSQLELGRKYSIGKEIPMDKVKAFEWFEKSAMKGNSAAQAATGNSYMAGIGVDKDYAKGIEWLKKSIDLGNPNASYSLGIAYLNGNGVLKDEKKAIKLIEDAANNGVEAAINMLGLMYQDGQGVKKDFKESKRWFLSAAKLGNTAAMNNLGMLYRDNKDFTNAIIWLKKTSDQGDKTAKSNLAYMYKNGLGVAKNASVAFSLFLDAAMLGDSDAQFEVGTAYLAGDGVELDPVLAYAWLNIASLDSKIREDVIRWRDEISLSKAELIEAQRISTEWVVGNKLIRDSKNLKKSVKTESSLLKRSSTGTGFIVNQYGNLITNAHVIEGCSNIKIEGHDTKVNLIATDANNDLALLKTNIKTKITPELSPNSLSLNQGDVILVFGYPWKTLLSSGGNLTVGSVSAMSGLANNTNQFQISAQVQPGSSGSPVINKNGYIVGVVTQKLSDIEMVKATKSIPQNVNFAVSDQTIKAFLKVNDVDFQTGRNWLKFNKEAADIADNARVWTKVVECWN